MMHYDALGGFANTHATAGIYININCLPRIHWTLLLFAISFGAIIFRCCDWSRTPSSPPWSPPTVWRSPAAWRRQRQRQRRRHHERKRYQWPRCQFQLQQCLDLGESDSFRWNLKIKNYFGVEFGKRSGVLMLFVVEGEF